MRHLRSILIIVFFWGQNAYCAPTVIRGPYLQSATPGSIVIRWRTSEVCDSRVSYGSSPATLTNVVDNNASVTEHEVKLTGLASATRYYYSIGTTALVLAGGADHYFQTLPLAGTKGKYRIGVFGDCGNNSANQLNIRDQVANYLGANYMNAWLLLGDNAYQKGLDAEYQSNFFNIYKNNFLKTSPLFPAPGNHDYSASITGPLDHNVPYYDIFTTPQQGEAGGVPSGTEAYYSFDYGNVHFLSLDSYGKEDNATRLYDTLGKQVTWIKQDLAANTNKDWVVAFWHHPPYTKGSHDSDTEDELVKIRGNFIRILERYGVDLILCGHSHDYERSKLMAGHYASENTFNPQVHQLSSSSGKYDGSADACPYQKSDIKKQGTIYVVAGSAGQLGGSQAGYPHNAFPYSDVDHGGALMMEIEDNRLDMKWICADGVIRDRFTVMKNTGQKKVVEMESGKNATLTASYVGSYLWNTGEQSRSITVSPANDAEFVVKDQFECVSDTFQVVVQPNLPVRLVSFQATSVEQNTVLLRWETASENNASHFVVERAADGRHFKKLLQVKAIGESIQSQTYTAIDTSAAPGHTMYYRLMQMDLDSTFSYSKIINVKTESQSEDFDFVIKPNPSDGTHFTLQWKNKLPAGAGITILNAAGFAVFSSTPGISGNTTISFDQPLLPGIYICRVSVGHQVRSKLMVISN